jgi:hypothetical protein
MNVEDVWRKKTDEQLAAAVSRISEYTEIGQHAILAELQRRGGLAAISDTATTAEASDADNSSQSPDESDPTQNGVIMSLWRGSVPLRKAYWICGVLTNVLWNMAIALSVAADFGFLAVSLAVLQVIYLLFISVAIWRSAGRYKGSRAWGELARLSVVVGLVRTMAGLFQPS